MQATNQAADRVTVVQEMLKAHSQDPKAAAQKAPTTAQPDPKACATEPSKNEEPVLTSQRPCKPVPPRPAPAPVPLPVQSRDTPRPPVVNGGFARRHTTPKAFSSRKRAPSPGPCAVSVNIPAAQAPKLAQAHVQRSRRSISRERPAAESNVCFRFSLRSAVAGLTWLPCFTVETHWILYQGVSHNVIQVPSTMPLNGDTAVAKVGKDEHVHVSHAAEVCGVSWFLRFRPRRKEFFLRHRVRAGIC